MFYLPNEILGKDFFVQRMCANEFRLLPIGVVECNAHDDRLDLVVVDRQAAGTTAELVKPNSQQPWKRSASLQRSFLHAGFWQTGTVAEDVITVNDVTRHSCGCRHQRWCDPQH